MNWQVQPSSNASVVPGGGIRFIDVSGEVVRIDGSFLRYGRGLVSVEKPNESTPQLFQKAPHHAYLRACLWVAC